MPRFSRKKGTRSEARGFTVIELLVSIAIFSIIAVVSIAALINTINISRNSQAFKTAFDNLTFALDSMSRNIRLGNSYHCKQTIDPFRFYNGSNQPSTSENGDTQDCSAGGIYLSFMDFQVPGQVNVYQYNNGAIETLYHGSGNNTTYIPITAPEVNITTFKFIVNGSNVCGFGASVRLIVGGTVTVGKQSKSFSMESFLSQRPWNLTDQVAGCVN